MEKKFQKLDFLVLLAIGNSVSWGMYLKNILKKIMQNSLR